MRVVASRLFRATPQREPSGSARSLRSQPDRQQGNNETAHQALERYERTRNACIAASIRAISDGEPTRLRSRVGGPSGSDRTARGLACPADAEAQPRAEGMEG